MFVRETESMSGAEGREGEAGYPLSKESDAGFSPVSWAHDLG